jgi:protein involved in polysaccharide export with SLBB domain
VAFDFPGALRGARTADVALRDGDVLIVDVERRTVRVEGAVERPTLVLWEPGLSVRDYIERAGGTTTRGQAHRAVVTSPAGSSRRVRRVAWLVRSEPDVPSGATIFVPQSPERTGGGSDALNRVMQIASSLASLVVAWSVARQ